MKLTIYKEYGFCWGVKRAVEKAEGVLKDKKSGYILGEIIHNPLTNKRLSKKGLKIVNSVEEVPPGSDFFYPSHGISKGNEKIAKDRKLKKHSLVCPFVINIEKLAREYEKKGYDIVVYGDKDHTEIKSLISRVKNYHIVMTKSDIGKLPKLKKILFISQSTQNKEKYYELFTELSKKANWEELVGKFTICNITFERQDWLMEHIEKFDYFIVMGGLNSSNTRKLYEIIENFKKDGIFIEEYSDKIWDKLKKYENIAIISGTSTPKDVVDDCVEKIKGRVEKNGNKININYA
ncbi:4-hydroxy-3-methylbut-2-enyl diphosphate reductase [bacterium]|nr:4-hydroxy-3-methylbut-2-enyl diphosphate reductase [bacterium]